MLTILPPIVLLCALAASERIPNSRVTKRHKLESPPVLLQRAILTSDIGKPHGAGFGQSNASVAQSPCAGVEHCPGAPCPAAPCQEAPITAAAPDQRTADAEFAREILREHVDALQDIASSDRRERMAAEQRAEEARVAQAAAEAALHKEQMAKAAAEAALHKEQMATAAQSTRAAQAEEDRVSAQALAHEALQNVTRVSAREAQRVQDAQRDHDALEARKALDEAAETAAETIANGTAAYVDRAVWAGKAEVLAEELRAKAADSGAVAESYGRQAEADEARSLEASKKLDDLQHAAQESAAREKALKAHATDLKLAVGQAEKSLQQTKQRVFDAREVTNSWRETAIEDLRRAADDAVNQIESSSEESMAHVERVRDQVSREQVKVKAEAKRRARQVISSILPTSPDFQLQNVIPFEVPQVLHR